ELRDFSRERRNAGHWSEARTQECELLVIVERLDLGIANRKLDLRRLAATCLRRGRIHQNRRGPWLLRGRFIGDGGKSLTSNGVLGIPLDVKRRANGVACAAPLFTLRWLGIGKTFGSADVTAHCINPIILWHRQSSPRIVPEIRRPKKRKFADAQS